MENSSDPKHGTFISRKNEASKLVQNFKKQFPKNHVEGMVFDADLVRKLLNHGTCEKLLIHFGATDEGELTLVLAPANKKSERIGLIAAVDGTLRHLEAGMKDDGDDHVLDRGGVIPPPFNVYKSE